MTEYYQLKVNATSIMASVIICLANNQKFNFSKYILDNMVRNLEAGVKFFMFSIFVQVFVNHQLSDMSHHKKIFVTPSLTKKVFDNIKRKGKIFSGIITPLFATMIVQAPKDIGDGSEVPTDTVRSTACLPDDTIFEEMARMGAKNTAWNEFSSTMASAIICLANNKKFNFSKYILDNMVLDLEKAKTSQTKEIANLKKIVKKLERKKKSRTSGLKRMYKGRIDKIDANGDLSLIDKTTQDQRRMNEEDLFRVNDLDGDEVIMDVIVELEKPLKKKDQIALDEKVARKLEA
nr:hypothetical protein [Tanacetum cinerariifolium]